jgi:hypothetical protein
MEELNNRHRSTFLESSGYKKHIQEAQYLYYQKKRQQCFAKIKDFFEEKTGKSKDLIC